MKIYKEIFRLALPNILSNISVPLISSVDTGLMGHLSAMHLAAVGSAAMIFNFLYWNFGFLRMGTTGLVAQAYGRKDSYEQSRIFFQAVVVALAISLALILLQIPLGQLTMQLMNLEGDLHDLATSYFYVRIWDAPATLLLYIFMAWFFGNQNAYIPLVLTIVINISNISLSFYLVRIADMGIAGVALGSVIANYLGVITAIIFIYKKYPVTFVKSSEITKNLRRFWVLNRDIFLRTVMLSLTFAFLYSMSATYGTIALAITVIILQFTNWMSYAVDGFAYASEAMVGKYTGEENTEATFTTIKSSMIAGLLLASIFSLIYGLFTEDISALFTSDAKVLDQIVDYRWWIVIIPLVGFASYIWDGVFVGLTASKAMRNTMLLSFVVFFGTYYLFENTWNYTALLLALTLYLVSRGIAQTVVFLHKKLELS